MVKWTTIALSEETRLKLESLGRKGETYEEILVKLLGKTGDGLQLQN